MTIRAGFIINSSGLTDQNENGSRATAQGWQSFTLTFTEGVTGAIDELGYLGVPLSGGGATAVEPVIGSTARKGGQGLNGIGSDFFERAILTPRSLSLGNILATITQQLDLYNSDRRSAMSFTAFVNNAGIGISITDLPTLPESIEAQTSQLMNLEISTEGPASLNGTLDFTVDGLEITITIVGNRIVLFPFRPEAPLSEQLKFQTDILSHVDGGEQRISPRKNPRQVFEMDFLRDEGSEFSKIELMLFGWHARVFGVPVWFEPTQLTAAASITDTSITVANTTLSDFRTSSLAIIFDDEDNFETLDVTGVTGTTITFSSPLTKNFSIGTEVLPVRVGLMQPSVRGSRFPVGIGKLKLNFRVQDNDVNLADVSAFNTFESKVLLDGPNAIEGLLQEGLERRIQIFDNGTGKFSQVGIWTRDKRTHRKQFVTNTRQELWDVRRLLHALKGRQIAFWIPTFYKALVPTQTLQSGTPTLTIENVGYAQFVQDRLPRNRLRLGLNNGTVLFRTVTASSEIDSTEEQLTLTSNWPSNILASDVLRIDFIEPVRIDSDEITLTHRDAAGSATVALPVRTVFDT